MRTFAQKLNVILAGVFERASALDVLIADPDRTVCVTSEVNALIAENRNCPVPLEVSVGSGFQVSSPLQVLVKGTSQVTTGLQVYVRSATLQVGAGAIFSCDGDEVTVTVVVQDTDGYHPEYIESLSVTLLYRGVLDQGTVTLSAGDALEAGSVQAFFIHPPSTTDLSVRIQGVVELVGPVDFTVPVSVDPTVGYSLTPHPTLDPGTPREEPTGFDSNTTQLDPAPEEVEEIIVEANTVVLVVDFREPVVVLQGDAEVTYTGGGNRLLGRLDGQGFVLQGEGVLPGALGAVTQVEPAGTNLAPTPDFLTPTSMTDAVPQGWTLTSDSSVTVLPEVVLDPSTVGVLQVRTFGSGNYVGAKALTFATTSGVPVPVGPVAFSVLARIEHHVDDVIVDDLRVVMSFRDSGDLELSSQVVTYDPGTIVGETFALLQNVIATAPVGTVAVRVSLVLESIETSDDLTLELMVPQVETTDAATSRMIGPRAADTLDIDIDHDWSRGTVIVEFAPAYQGSPGVDACVFDSRDLTEDNGLALFHLATGELQFIVATAAEFASLTSTPVSLPVGEVARVELRWTQNTLAITLGGTEIGASSTSVVPPFESNPIIIFQTATGTNRLPGVIQRFEILRDVT